MKYLITCCAGLAALMSAGAWAQSGPGPIDPSVTGAPLRYESSFTGYRSYAEEPLRSWRGVNDEVQRVGGHAGVLGMGESKRSPDPQPQPTPPEGAKPKPAEAASAHPHRH